MRTFYFDSKRVKLPSFPIRLTGNETAIQTNPTQSNSTHSTHGKNHVCTSQVEKKKLHPKTRFFFIVVLKRLPPAPSTYFYTWLLLSSH